MVPLSPTFPREAARLELWVGRAGLAQRCYLPSVHKNSSNNPRAHKESNKKGQTAKARRFKTHHLLGVLDPKHSCYSWKVPKERRLQELAWWLGEEVKTADITYKTTWFLKWFLIIFVAIISKIRYFSCLTKIRTNLFVLKRRCQFKHIFMSFHLVIFHLYLLFGNYEYMMQCFPYI